MRTGAETRRWLVNPDPKAGGHLVFLGSALAEGPLARLLVTRFSRPL